jgi:hypothetical protein
VNSTLEPCNCCKRASEKARAVLTQITKNFYNRQTHILEALQAVYEATPPVCLTGMVSMAYRRHEVLERVQEKVLRMTTGLKGSTYEEGCKEVGTH